MKPYIFGRRNTIHIVDIRETVKGLLRAKRFLTQVVAKGEDVLFVGTKRQARHHIREQSARVGMPFVAERWLGGTLTNFRTIRSRVTRLDELETAEADGSSLEYSKKMIASRSRELRKIRRNLEGIRGMSRLPGALVVIDVHREKNSVREAKALGIPTVCLIDTDSDPDFADVPIPGNDDAMRSIQTILRHMADAVEEGLKARTAPQPAGDDAPAGRRRGGRATTGRPDGGAPESRPSRGGSASGGALERDAGGASAGLDSDLTPAALSEREAPA